jgi:glycosyltransferase involved in cell wall biosynthesis
MPEKFLVFLLEGMGIRMRIGIVAAGGFYPVHNGSIAIISYEMANYLAGLGHDILVLVPLKNYEDKGKIKPSKGLSFEFIHTSLLQYFVRGNLEVFRSLTRLRRECDIIHYNVPPTSFEILVPFFMHAKPQTYWYLGDVHNYPFRFSIFTLIMRFFDRIFVCCNYTVDLLKRMKVLPEKIAYIEEGINIKEFSLADPLKLEGTPAILYVGRLNLRDKDIMTLLEAFALVSEAIPNACLHIVGGGKDQNECQKYATKLKIQGKVMWWGAKDHIKLPRYFKGADFVVYPISQSLSTGMGLVILEAMAACKPVITTAIYGNMEFLRDGENALLYPLGDSKILAEKMLMLYQNPELSKKIANNGSHFAQGFDWEKVVSKLVESWKELCKSSN